MTKRRIVKFLEAILISSRWLIVPLYFLLLFLILPYSAKAFREVFEVFSHFNHLQESELMLCVLSLTDLVMIINLVQMIAVGSYQIFVRKLYFADELDKPQWLTHINSSTLKIKMGMSIIGVSSIHLLKDFVNVEQTGWTIISKHSAIHLLFIVSTMALAYIDKHLHVHQTDNNNVKTTH